MSGVDGHVEEQPAGGQVRWIFLLCRRADLSVEEFRAYYEDHHARIGERVLTRATRYVRRYLDPVPDRPEAVDGFDVVTELWFATYADFEAQRDFLRRDDVRPEIAADEERFIDTSRTQTYLIRECESLLTPLSAT